MGRPLDLWGPRWNYKMGPFILMTQTLAANANFMQIFKKLLGILKPLFDWKN